MTMFQYSPAVLARYPHLIGGVLVARGVTNPPASGALSALFAAEQEAVKARLGEAALSEIPSLRAWRDAFSAFGVAPTQYRSAAESLLRRLTKKGDIPGINTLVDIGNLVSIRYALPVAILDTRQINGVITVRFADGSEGFTDLGSDEIVHPEAGEVIFVDERGMAVARRWCWRQSATSASNAATTDAIITVEGHHASARADVERALHDLEGLLSAYAGGEFTHAILSAQQPAL